MSFVHNNQRYPTIYNQQTMDQAQSSKQLFNNPVNQFISEQTKKLPFKQEGGGDVFVVYERRPYYHYSSSFHVDNSTNIYTGSGLRVQNQRNNQAAALVIATIVTTVATFLAAKYYNEYKAIKEDIDNVQDFKDTLVQMPGHDHLDALKKVTNLRLKELDSAKAYVLAKSAIVISTLVSGIFLGIAALAAPELMAAGAIATGLSLLAGVFTWSFERYDSAPKKIAEAVRDQLNYLKNQTQAIPLFREQTQQTEQTRVPHMTNEGNAGRRERAPKNEFEGEDFVLAPK